LNQTINKGLNFADGELITMVTSDDYWPLDRLEKQVDFFQNRRIAVNLPSPAAKVIWQVRNATQPQTIRVRKAGKYWNVVHEQF
jgi:hypothetical protein